jgi:hypothetical protein
LEVIACVRHFQDGYLPLWTPHCAVTSGYTASYERWRKKPSDSFEFRSFDDVNGALSRTEIQSSETSSNSSRNGFTGKKIEKAGEKNCPSGCQESRGDSGNGLLLSVDDHQNEDCSENRHDILASSPEYDEGEVRVINGDVTNTISDVPRTEYDRKFQEVFTADFTSVLQTEEHPVNVSAQCEDIISRTLTESPVVPPSQSVLKETFSHDTEFENSPVSIKEIDDIENEVPAFNTGDELRTSSLESVTERNFEGESPDILSGKCPAHKIIETELELEVRSSDLNSREMSDTKSAFGEPDVEIPVPEGTPAIPLLDIVPTKHSSTVPELDHIPATEIGSQTASSDFAVDNSFSTTIEREGEIPNITSETNITSSCLQRQEGDPIFEVVTGESSSSIGEAFGKHQDDTVTGSRVDSVASAILNSEHRHQNSFVPSCESRETSVTAVRSSTEHSVARSNDQIAPDLADNVNEKPCSLPELDHFRKEHPDSNSHVESDASVGNAKQHLSTTDVHAGVETFKSQVENSASCVGTGGATNMQQALEEDLKQEHVRNITVEARTINKTGLDLEEGGPGTQHDVLNNHIRHEPASVGLQDEEKISVANVTDDAQQDVSESRLDTQTTLTDSVTSRDESASYDDDSGFPGSGSLTKCDVEEPFNLQTQTSSITSVTPLTIDTSIQSSPSPSPLTIDTSLETSASVTQLPTDYQPPLSPPKFPSVPRKPKADISWPTFFPGTPVIKRPSVSFATPESVFTNEDEKLLRQFVEEASVKSTCIKIPGDACTTTKSETTSDTSEGKFSESAGTPGSSDSLEEEEEPIPIVCREKSPSRIVSGNDFSRKELKLQRRKSYRQKRYNSAIEIRAQDEEAEDRSFSENRPELIRASSVKEPRKRYRKPAKASSFEDLMLRDIETGRKGERTVTDATEEIADVSIPEARETGSEEIQGEEQENIEAVTEETKRISDITDCLKIQTERNETKLNDSNLQQEENATESKEAAEGRKDEETRDDGEDCSVSEEQSLSEQKSAPKEAFWVSSDGGTH